MKIEKFSFNDEGRQRVGEKSKGKDWPVVYIINNEKKVYVGETTSIYNRFAQHLVNYERRDLDVIRIVFDDEFNKSAILDIEQSLIQLFSADNKFQLLNRNSGQSSKHNYYERERYREKVPTIWDTLKEKEGLANKSYADLTNTDLFKYSPYMTLTAEQKKVSSDVLESIISSLETGENTTHVIHGSAGTGKTIVAINTIFQIVYFNSQNVDIIRTDSEEEMDERFISLFHRFRTYVIDNGSITVGFVLPMVSFRNTLRAVFRATGNGLRPNLVIGPNDVRNMKYDVLFVDESHRLSQRRNITAMGAYDNVCRTLGFDNPNTTTQLDWIIKQSKCRVLFYDEKQSVKGSDMEINQFEDTVNRTMRKDYYLRTQMRCLGGTDYVNYLSDVFECKNPNRIQPINFDCLVFEDPNEMISRIKLLNKTYGLCRTVAGYSWGWRTKGLSYEEAKEQDRFDIELNGKHYIWNTKPDAWILSENAVNEIGCVHTSQGYDLNYVAVVFGHEIDYDPENNKIIVNKNSLYDQNVKRGVTDDALKAYIVNAYKVMLTRGIKGCFMYACNKNLQDYLKQYFEVEEAEQVEMPRVTETISPYVIEPEISTNLRYNDYLPLFTMKAACGYFGESEQVGDYDWIKTEGLGRLSQDMFVVKASGRSMEPKIFDGDYCVFEKYSGGSRNGEIVLAQHVGYFDEDNMGSYSIKEYRSEKVAVDDGSWEHTSIVLHPLNAEYSDIVIDSDDADSFKIIGIYKGKIKAIDHNMS